MASHGAKLDVINHEHVRLSFSAHEKLMRTVTLDLDEDAAWPAWNDIVAIFERSTTSRPI